MRAQAPNISFVRSLSVTAQKETSTWQAQQKDMVSSPVENLGTADEEQDAKNQDAKIRHGFDTYQNCDGTAIRVA